MSGQPREVEGVLLVSADDQEGAGRRVAALERVDRFELRPRPTQRIRDVYLDTGDGALAGARVAFRVRELDGQPLLTVKANPVRSGLVTERLELEAPWSAEALRSMLEELRRHGVQLPGPPEGTEAGEPLADLAGLGLHPTQSRHTTRIPRDVHERGTDGGPVAELTVDDVAYLPAGVFTVRLLAVPPAEVRRGRCSLCSVHAQVPGRTGAPAGYCHGQGCSGWWPLVAGDRSLNAQSFRWTTRTPSTPSTPACRPAWGRALTGSSGWPSCSTIPSGPPRPCT